MPYISRVFGKVRQIPEVLANQHTLINGFKGGNEK